MSLRLFTPVPVPLPVLQCAWKYIALVVSKNYAAAAISYTRVTRRRTVKGTTAGRTRGVHAGLPPCRPSGRAGAAASNRTNARCPKRVRLCSRGIAPLTLPHVRYCFTRTTYLRPGSFVAACAVLRLEQFRASILGGRQERTRAWHRQYLERSAVLDVPRQADAESRGKEDQHEETGGCHGSRPNAAHPRWRRQGCPATLTKC